jgi:alkylation response protein AidB-like acyl-CoA dehydrogenase
MAAATSSFLADRRELDFILFEYLNLESLLSFPYFSDHTKDSLSEMLTSAINLCNQTVGPLNKAGDRIGCQHDKVTKAVTTPPGTKEAYKLFVEGGFMTASDAEAASGFQVPNLLTCSFLELLSGANQAFAMYAGLTKSASHVLWACGEEWMKKNCVAKIAEGKWTGTMCLTEPSAGSAVGDLKTSAKRNADGSFRIKGIKQWISGGENDFAENILHLVLARIEGAPSGMEGVSLFLVPKIKFNKETGALTEKNDLYCISLEEKMGIHGNSTCLMSFGDNDKCEGYLIGKENNGIAYMFLMMNEARIAVGLQGVAQSSVAFLNAEKYAKERVQGVDITVKKDAVNPPRIAIVNHPDVKRMLLRQRAIVEGGRTICYLSAYYHDVASHSTDAEERKKAHNTLELLTPIVKAWCTDMGFASIVTSMQTFGGYGFTKDYPIEQLLRDSKISSIYEGTNGIQALDFVGRKMRLEEGQVFMSWLERHTNFIEKNRDNKEIATECEIVEEYVGLLVETAMKMSELAKKGDRKAAVVNAYPYLMAFGHTTIGGLFLEQSKIALENLARTDLSSADRKFYGNKIKTSKFFIHHILPEAKAYLSNVTSDDRSCLDFDFT